jgi:gentisate 1,2-dioxygenase
MSSIDQKYNQTEEQPLIQHRKDYARRIREQYLKEGWSYDVEQFETRPYWPLEPKNDVQFHLWTWKEIAPLIREAKKVVKVGRGTGSYDRRVVSLCNPGLGDRYAATATLFADIQLLTEGEEAPSHKHTPCATRFVIEGEGWTNVEGDRVQLTPGDIAYCGPNFWHDHKNESSEDLIFLDVLDIPLLQYLGVSEWYFNYPEVTGSEDEIHYPTNRPKDFNETHSSYKLSWARPRFEVPSRKYNEVQQFSWLETKQLLLTLKEEEGSLYDDIIIQFQNPNTGNPVGSTVDICSQMIRSGKTTKSHRHTWATICLCVEGAGQIIIDKEEHSFEQWDIFVIPGWTWHAWQNTNETPCFIHTISDFSMMERLGFAREHRDNKNGLDSGWQAPPFVRIQRDDQ